MTLFIMVSTAALCLIDLLLFLFGRTNQCALQPLFNFGPNFMIWMEFIVIMESILLVLATISLVANILQIHRMNCNICGDVYIVGLLLKLGVSVIIETMYFFDSISSCDGVVYAYGLISLIFHALIVAGGLIAFLQWIRGVIEMNM